MSEWQPIETAPKGESYCVLLFITGVPEWKQYSVGFWSDHFRAWYGTSPSARGVIGPEEPTHWMPLPQPPQA